jgi:hypothetical protein
MLGKFGKKMNRKNKMGVSDRSVPFNWQDAGSKIKNINKMGISDFTRKKKSFEKSHVKE